MACALTADYALDCKESVGGIKKLWLMAHQDIATIALTAGVVTTLTKDTGKKFYYWDLQKFTSELKENHVGTPENGTNAYNQEISFVVNKLNTAIRNEMLLVAKNTLVAVVEDNNGKFWMVGRENGADLTATAATSGVTLTDRSGYQFTITASEKESMCEVNSTIAAQLGTAGS